jgi:hypothetical protein
MWQNTGSGKAAELNEKKLTKLWWEMDKSMYPPTRQLLLDPDDVNVTQISGRRISS